MRKRVGDQGHHLDTSSWGGIGPTWPYEDMLIPNSWSLGTISNNLKAPMNECGTRNGWRFRYPEITTIQ